MSLKIWRAANRYFVCFSYLGSRYWGVQRQVASRSLERDNTIQSAIETAINSTITPRPINHPVSSVVSSRTDRLVHGSENVLAMDLFHPIYGMTYDQDYVTDCINKWMYQNDHLILVKKTVQVPRGYHIRRQAREREYILRVVYNPNSHGAFDAKVWYDLASRIDLSSVSVVPVPSDSTKLDIDKVCQAIELMKGSHDFRSFEASQNRRKERNSVETITKFTVTEVDPRTGSRMDPVSSDLIFLDFVVSSGSFLYKQVRRMVGMALTVGLGCATLDEVKFLLKNPDRNNWKRDRYLTAMPSGLYLRRIHFPGIS